MGLQPQQFVTQQAAHFGGGVKAVRREPGRILSDREPTVEPEVVGRWLDARRVHSASHDNVLQSAQMRGRIVACRLALHTPKDGEGRFMPDADHDRPQQPVAAHGHGRQRRAVRGFCVLP